MSGQILSSLTLGIHELYTQCSGWFDRCLTVGPVGSSGCVCIYRSSLTKPWLYRGVHAAFHVRWSLKRIRYPSHILFQTVLFLFCSSVFRFFTDKSHHQYFSFFSAFKPLHQQHKYRINTYLLHTKQVINSQSKTSKYSMGCKLSAQISEKTFTKQYIHVTITYQKFSHQEQTFAIYWICIPEYNLIFNQTHKSTMHKIRNLKIVQHDTVTVLW